jgi:hypothetical protein
VGHYGIRQPLAAPPVLNQTWALDFMTETLYDSRRVGLLTVIDEGNREGPLPGVEVARLPVLTINIARVSDAGCARTVLADRLGPVD